MPVSYQGFGFTTIILMIALLSANQLIRYLRVRHEQRSAQKMVKTTRALKK